MIYTDLGFLIRLHSKTRNPRRKLVRILLRSSMAAELTVISLHLELGAAVLGRLPLLLLKLLNQVNKKKNNKKNFRVLPIINDIFDYFLLSGDLNLVCDILKDPTLEDRERHQQQPHREIMCSGITRRGLIQRRFIISLINPSLFMGIP